MPRLTLLSDDRHVLRLKLAALEILILAAHPYETPEFVALPLTHGSPAYLKWLADSIITIDH